MKNTWKILLLLLGECCIGTSLCAQTTIYVRSGEQQDADGSKKAPFTSLIEATDYIKNLRANGNQKEVRVLVYPGLYELETSLTFTPLHNTETSGTITFSPAEEGNVVLSGGRHIKNWKEITPNHWVALLPEVKAGNWYFRQLFAGHQRLQRAKTPNEGFYTTKGALSPYAKELGKYRSLNQKDENPAAFWLSRCGFAYRDRDIQYWDDWQNAEILTFHSWECSWQAIQAIDTVKRDVYFTSPCRYPVGSFGQAMRYRIENIASALDMPGEWFLDRKTGELHLLTNEGENPNQMNIHAPRLTRILEVRGESGHAVANIRFEQIQFQYTDYKMGLYDIAPKWPAEIQEAIPYFPADIRPGFTGAQAAPTAGSSLKLVYADRITFERCGMRHLGAIAVRIAKGCNEVVLNGCEIADTGAGGVYMGEDIRLVDQEGMPESDSPKRNVVSNCLIHSLGHVHPAAVGVWMAQTSDNKIVNNEISYVSYSGVSLGWTWSFDKNYTKNNYIARNYIHHTAQVLGDAAGIYSLGDCSGSVYDGNYIDQIYKGDGVHGVVDAMGFDECSSHITIRNNVVGKVSGKVASFGRRSSAELQEWDNNNFSMKVERPVLEHKPGMEASQMAVVARFKPVSTFINLSGWLEQRWLVRKNGDSNKDGFFGILIEGKQAVAYMNIGGGSKNVHRIASESSLVNDDVENLALLSYDGQMMRFYFNNKLVGEKAVNQSRTTGQGKLEIAPISANSLRNGIEELKIYPAAATPETVQGMKASFSWKAKKEKFRINEKKVMKEAGPDKKYEAGFIRMCCASTGIVASTDSPL